MFNNVKSGLEKLPPWLFSIVTLVAIAWLTLAPQPFGETDIPLFPGADKVAHACMFGGLVFAFLFDRIRKSNWRRPSFLAIICAIFAASSLGLLVEILQGAMGCGRSFDWLDFFADTAGACVVGICFNKISRRILEALLLLVALIPVLVYLPPVQRLAKDIACREIAKSTGLKINIGEIALRFPLNLNLRNVLVLDQKADTMLRASNVRADIHLLPLLNLDVKVKRLKLENAFYRMVSPDSSMILSLNAGLLETDSHASANFKTNEINLDHALLRNGRVTVLMDVWKQKNTPDSASQNSTPFLIKAKHLSLENFSYGMSMLPTIDTLCFNARSLQLANGVIDLRANRIHWEKLSALSGSASYIAPSPEWVAAHPAPVSQPSDTPPFRIAGDSIALDDFTALYEVRGTKPQPGFNPGRIRFENLSLGLHDFYNEAATVNLPISRISGKESSGLTLSSGNGSVNIDSIGLNLKEMNIHTPYSNIRGNADIPFALMELNPDADMNVDMLARIGLPDIDMFMPDLKQYTRLLPARNPLDLNLRANGSLKSLAIQKLKMSLTNIFSIQGAGSVENPLNIKKMVAAVSFQGALDDPRLIARFTGQSAVRFPKFRIKGKASAVRENYGASFSLISTIGDVVGQGEISLNSEKYNVKANLNRLNIAGILPSLEIGKISGTVLAKGRGFNPAAGNIVTNTQFDISSIEYKHREYRNIKATLGVLPDGTLSIDALSNNKGLNFQIAGTGNILPDNYTFNLRADLRDIDLQSIGLSESINSGKGVVTLRGNARPERWLYNADLNVSNLEWNLPEQFIQLPEGIKISLNATDFETSASLSSRLASMDFKSPMGLKYLVDSLSVTSQELMAQLKEENLIMNKLSQTMPKFSMQLNAAGRGVLSQFLVPMGLNLDTIYGSISKDSSFNASLEARNLFVKSMNLDTISLRLGERRNLLDYKIHIGNKEGTMDEFAQVDLNGYLGNNRLGAFLTQKNIAGATGYKIGMTVAKQDSLFSLHFTPLNATIAYLPWELNDDNYIDFNPFNKKVDANLQAQSAESSILLKTQPTERGIDELLVKLDNIYIQDFLKLSVLAPPVRGNVNTDLHILYDGSVLSGSGTIGVKRLMYEKTRLGDFLLDVNAGMANDGSSNIDAGLRIDGKRALSAYANMRNDSTGVLKPDSLELRLQDFPLKLANPFLSGMAALEGSLNGRLKLDGSFSNPILNGQMNLAKAAADISMTGSSLNFDSVPISIVNNILNFNNFNITGANQNPLTIDGNIDIRNLTNPLLDLSLNAQNCQLLNTDRRSKGDIFGKLFVNLNASLKGSLALMDIKGNLNILGNTNLTYRLGATPMELTSGSSEGVVKFVNFNDTSTVVTADSVPSEMAMRIRTALNISPGAKMAAILTTNSNDRVELQPSGTLNFYQNFLGDQRLNGTLNLGNGFARISVPVMGEKMFTLNQGSSVTWGGALMNPNLNISAVDELRANVTQGASSRLVNFLVTLSLGGNLNNPAVNFDLATNDDISIQNELQSMSADQRQTQAMNLLLYGQYSGQNIKGSTNLGGSLGENVLFGMLQSTLNSWAAQNIPGVDLSFGINQYDTMEDGANSTATSYSYQVSKSFFNDKFKILVGGNYSTGSSPDENLSQNLISDITFEYIIRQTETTNMSARAFRHTGFESMLEGEITETGGGVMIKRKSESLWNLFRLGRKRKNKTSGTAQNVQNDSTVSADSKPSSNKSPLNK